MSPLTDWRRPERLCRPDVRQSAFDATVLLSSKPDDGKAESLARRRSVADRKTTWWCKRHAAGAVFTRHAQSAAAVVRRHGKSATRVAPPTIYRRFIVPDVAVSVPKRDVKLQPADRSPFYRVAAARGGFRARRLGNDNEPAGVRAAVETDVPTGVVVVVVDAVGVTAVAEVASISPRRPRSWRSGRDNAAAGGTSTAASNGRGGRRDCFVFTTRDGTVFHRPVSCRSVFHRPPVTGWTAVARNELLPIFHHWQSG